METILLAVMLVLYLAVVFVFTTSQTSKKSVSARFLTRTPTLQTYTTYLSELGTDVGFWLFALLPIAASALSDSLVSVIIVLIFTCAVLAALRTLITHRMRLYAEICGSPVTLTDFIINRFHPKTSFPFRILFGSLLTVLPLICGVGILIFAADFLATVSGWSYLLCVILCSFAVLLCIFQTGLVVTFRSGILHSLLLFVAFVMMTCFSLFGPNASAQTWQNVLSDTLLLPTDAEPYALINYASAGLCLFGLPTVYQRMMRQKARHGHKRHTVVYLALFLAFAFLVTVPYLFGVAQGYSGMQALIFVAGSSSAPIFGAVIFTALTIGMTGAAASLLSVASSSLWNDLILPIRKREITTSTERKASTFIGLAACLSAFFLRDFREDLFSFSIVCLAAVLGPTLFFALYGRRTSALSVAVASVLGLFTAVLFRFMIFPTADYITVLPAALVSTLTLFVFSFFTKKTSRRVLNEFDRVHLLLHSDGDLFHRVSRADFDEVSHQ